MEEENKNVEVENQEVETILEEKVETIEDVKSDNLVQNDTENNKQSGETGKKKNVGIYIIIGILILLVVCVLLFIFVFNKENNNDNNNNNNNNSNLNNVTVSDDVTNSDDVVDSDNSSGVESVGYTKEDFVNDLKNGIEVDLSKTNIVEVVNFDKFLTPYKLIVPDNNNDDSISYFGLKKCTLYKMNNDYFIVNHYEEGSLYDEGEIISFDIINNYNNKLLEIGKYLVNLSDNSIINLDECSESMLDKHITKNGNFYVAVQTSCESGYREDIILNKNYEYLKPRYVELYYIKDDNMFYIEDNKLKKLNSKSEIITFDDIVPLRFKESNLLYLNQNGHLMVKDMLNDKVIFSSNLKISNKNLDVFFDKIDNGYTISIDDEWESRVTYGCDSYDACFLEFVKDNNMSIDEYENAKNKCYIEDYGNISQTLGIKFNYDLKGDLISSEYECYD